MTTFQNHQQNQPLALPAPLDFQQKHHHLHHHLCLQLRALQLQLKHYLHHHHQYQQFRSASVVVYSTATTTSISNRTEPVIVLDARPAPPFAPGLASYQLPNLLHQHRLHRHHKMRCVFSAPPALPCKTTGVAHALSMLQHFQHYYHHHRCHPLEPLRYQFSATLFTSTTTTNCHTPVKYQQQRCQYLSYWLRRRHRLSPCSWLIKQSRIFP
jgi:hypothetical protein